MMHLVATNLILWIEAICKESVEEIIEHEKEQMGVDEFGLGSKLVRMKISVYISGLLDGKNYVLRVI